MLRKIKNYFWNIASIILIIIIAESVYLYNKINIPEKYKSHQQSKVKLTCKLNAQYPELFDNSTCGKLKQSMLEPIHSYILSFYSLEEKDVRRSFNIKGLDAFYTIKFEIQKNRKIIKFN